MASRGKSEIMAGVFAVASNDFMTEYHDSDISKEAHEDSDNEEQTAD